jgi:hypothetical protein
MAAIRALPQHYTHGDLQGGRDPPLAVVVCQAVATAGTWQLLLLLMLLRGPEQHHRQESGQWHSRNDEGAKESGASLDHGRRGPHIHPQAQQFQTYVPPQRRGHYEVPWPSRLPGTGCEGVRGAIPR